MPKDETSNPVASEEIEQPTDGAVDEGTQVSNEPTDAAPPSEETQNEEAELLAGKYTSVEELIKGYQNATAEASRLAAEKAAYERGVQTASQGRSTRTQEEAPKYSPEQLKQYKTGYLSSLADAQAARRLALKDGDFDAASKFEAQATKAAEQITLIDDELGKIERTNSARQARQESAARSLEGDAKKVLQSYQPKLQQGTPFYEKAEELWQHYLDLGMPNNAHTQAMAVALAAELTGTKASAAPETRKNLTQSIQTALKQGVVAGAGKAKRTATPVNFMEMSDKEFIEYKKARGME